jgi:hypothetical protein
MMSPYSNAFSNNLLARAALAVGNKQMGLINYCNVWRNVVAKAE